MPCLIDDIVINPAITREQESRLYVFLRKETENEAFRYMLIATKIGRAANGTAVDWELAIVKDWLDCMLEEEAAANATVPAFTVIRPEPFADIRLGFAGNPKYQAYLDTLEQDELNIISSNIGYFAWMSQRLAEMRKSDLKGTDFLRDWADKNLSQRVKAIRGMI